MFKRFFEKMAGKASLANVKFDLDNLRQSFPHSPSAVSVLAGAVLFIARK